MIRSARVLRVPAALLAIVMLGLAACSSSHSAASPSGAGDGSGTVTVFAASSLTGAFKELAAQFEHSRPGAHVQLNFGGSSTLAVQILNGAPADVFASADQASMAKATSAGLIDGQPRIFARNLLEIVVAPGNPKHIGGLPDLDRSGLAISMGGPSVPVGRYSRQAFARAGVRVPTASEETDVKQIINKVELGQADAGVVYVTDVQAAAGHVSGVAIPSAENVEASYPLGVVKGGPDTTGGREFADFVTSPAGLAVQARYGFLAP